jgi:hypothetical protein
MLRFDRVLVVVRVELVELMDEVEYFLFTLYLEPPLGACELFRIMVVVG